MRLEIFQILNGDNIVEVAFKRRTIEKIIKNKINSWLKSITVMNL